MSRPILPPVDTLVTAAVDAIVRARPSALPHFNSGGEWTRMTSMWRAQALLVRARLADEIKSRRFRFAKGDALRALCASESLTSLPPSPQTAYATITLQRPASPGPPGAIKSGTQFVKTAMPDGIALPAANAYPLPVAAATYTVTAAVPVPAPDIGALTQTVTVKAVATSPGAAANVPIFTNARYGNPPTLITPQRALFDPTFVVVGCTAAGGSSGLPDDVLLAAARAMNTGIFGPTDGAIVAGILSMQSARHMASFDASGFLPYGQVYVADESWSSNDQWVSQVAQNFVTNWQGFGCRVRFGAVVNLHIAVAANIVLASTDALNNTDDIDANVRAVAESYFNDRPDWYSWSNTALRAALSAADSRILHCSCVKVTDAATGVEVTETSTAFAGSNVFQTSWSPTVTHYYLVDQGVTTTYGPPS